MKIIKEYNHLTMLIQQTTASELLMTRHHYASICDEIQQQQSYYMMTVSSLWCTTRHIAKLCCYNVSTMEGLDILQQYNRTQQKAMDSEQTTIWLVYSSFLGWLHMLYAVYRCLIDIFIIRSLSTVTQKIYKSRAWWAREKTVRYPSHTMPQTIYYMWNCVIVDRDQE